MAKSIKIDRVYVEYIDNIAPTYGGTKESIVGGHFSLVEETINYIRIRSAKNELTLPWSRVIKVKKLLKGGRS